MRKATATTLNRRTESQQQREIQDTRKSRALIGFVENSMNGSFIRTIGIARAKAKIGMMNVNIQYLFAVYS